jgi:CelD/BcsL family acetyltransferase involved in cellulose biosynthesis
VPESRAPRLLDPGDERWVAFAESSPQATIFHHPAWVNLLTDCYGYHPFIVAVDDVDGRIRAGVPMMELRSPLTGRRWVSLPFTDHCTPLCRDADAVGSLTDAVVQISEAECVPRVELRGEYPRHPEIQPDSHHVLHVVRLGPDVDSVTGRIHRMHKRNTKAARKKGVHIEWGQQREHLDAFCTLHLETRRRQGIPIQPQKFFDLLGSTIIEQGLGFVLLAYKDDQCLAAAVFLHWRHTLIYKYGASSTEGWSLRPNNLLFWSAIRWGCENGYTLLDMGKTELTNTGLREFKDRWGAEEVPLTYSFISATPPRPANGRLMHVMRTVIRNSPPWACKAAGSLLYRHFG